MKKGFIFIPLLVTLSLVVLTLAYYLYLTTERESTTKVLGELQTDAIKEIYNSEKNLFEIDTNVRFNVIRSLNILADRGGVRNDNILTESSIREVNTLFKETFENQMKEYLSKIYLDLSYSYFYNLDKNKIEIRGIANKELTFSKGVFSYKVKPSFRVVVDYDLNEYIKLYDDFKDVKECPSNEELRVFKGVWRGINCIEGNSWTYFEVEGKDLGYMKPVIKFKIPKNS